MIRDRLYAGVRVRCKLNGWFGVILDIVSPGEEYSEAEYRVAPLTGQHPACWTDWYTAKQLEPLGLLELIAVAAAGYDDPE